MRLAVFDLDNTLLAGDSDYLWGRFLVDAGVVERDVYERENERFYRQYQAGTLDIHEYAAFALRPLIEHELSQMLELRRRFVDEQIAPIVAAQAPALLARHRAQGDQLIITTATNRFVTEPIADLLGVDHLLATDPEIVDGIYTGRISGIPNFQGGKVSRLRAWIDAQTAPCSYMSCYSDSHNDIPLLEMADTAVAVDADPILEELAGKRGWQRISLRTPA
ncbi:MAG: HAD-IB family hydrolase [Nevskiales bacterium]|nr:HAD-IB family hydrolase [Nevskiales bacterium]